MLELCRTVRFCLNGPEAHGGRGKPERHNGYSGWPPMRGLGRFYELAVRCVGEADPVTGYFLNITHIDAAVRDHLLPHLEAVLADPAAATDCGAGVPMGELMRQMIALLREPLHNTTDRLTFQLTPFHSLEIRSSDMSHVILRQRYDFSAAHRLHVPELSDEENRRTFGKCNNPSGHGHNYKVEVCVSAAIGRDGRVVMVEDLDAVVDRAVIQPLDHKHLNLDVPRFAQVNPSVENIAAAIFDMLGPAVRAMGVELEEVSVWETEKTVCTYRGE